MIGQEGIIHERYLIHILDIHYAKIYTQILEAERTGYGHGDTI